MKIINYYRYPGETAIREVELSGNLNPSTFDGPGTSADYVFIWEPEMTELCSIASVIRLTPGPGETGQFSNFKFWISGLPETEWLRLHYKIMDEPDPGSAYSSEDYSEVPIESPETSNLPIMNDAEYLVDMGQSGEYYTKYLSLVLRILKLSGQEIPRLQGSLTLHFSWISSV